MLVDSALSLSSKKRHNKSTLVVDQILCTHHFGIDVKFSTSPTIISFITILQELERLYIYRSAYQQKVWSECEGKEKFLYIIYREALTVLVCLDCSQSHLPLAIVILNPFFD